MQLKQCGITSIEITEISELFWRFQNCSKSGLLCIGLLSAWFDAESIILQELNIIKDQTWNTRNYTSRWCISITICKDLSLKAVSIEMVNSQMTLNLSISANALFDSRRRTQLRTCTRFYKWTSPLLNLEQLRLVPPSVNTPILWLNLQHYYWELEKSQYSG